MAQCSPSRLTLISSLLLTSLGACHPGTQDGAPETGLILSALVETAEGVHLYPPLAPAPTSVGIFDPTLLPHLSVTLEATTPSGGYATLATFDRTTSPALQLFEGFQTYFVNVPAAPYFTDPSRTYRFRVLRDGAQLASATMDPLVFTVLASSPGLLVGVKFRVDSCTPSPEVCDGIDNDCNGAIDDGVVLHGACDTGLAGICAAGTEVCSGGAVVCAQTTQAHAETCDGVDEDCNGVVDDGVVLTASCTTGLPGACSVGTEICANGAVACQQSAQPTPEVCDGVDNDCNGAVDDGVVLHATCDTGLPGICATGSEVCVDGGVVCMQVTQPQPETCDGVDEDCNGVIDDGCSHCTPSAEICDGLDNDCNGVADDDVALHACSTGLLGACAAGTEVCANGALSCAQTVQPQAEICGNGIDDNCNGVVDDGACGPVTHTIAATNDATCAIGATGGVKCWGNNGGYGRPIDIAGISNAVSLAGGGFDFCAVLANGDVKCWSQGALSAGAPVAGVHNAVKVGVSYFSWYCALINDGTVTCWGTDASYVVQPPTTQWDANGTITGVIDMSVGGGHTCVLRNGGAVECWGSNRTGALGDGTTNAAYLPVYALGVNDAIGVWTSPFSLSSCAIRADHSVLCWGENRYGELGIGNAISPQPTPVPVPGLSGVATLSSGEHHMCARLLDGSVKCWGDNTWGELGQGYSGAQLQLSAVSVPNLSGLTDLVSGIRHTCGKLADGTMQCWGANYSYQVGDRTTQDRSVPTSVWGMPCVYDANGQCLAGCSQFVSCTTLGVTSGEVSDGCLATLYCGPATQPEIGTGESFSCGVRNDGTVRCWGRNNQAQLGNNAPGGNRTTAVAVSNLTGARGIALGQQHACATKSDGTVWCWGWNRNGQLGNNATSSSPVPVQVSGITTAVAVASGREFSCARLANNTVQCWGQDTLGQLGDGGNVPNRLTPVPVQFVADVVQISAGGDWACGLQSNGTVACWGVSATLGFNYFAAPVANVTNARGIYASLDGSHVCATLADASTVCWGANASGQLGDGTTTARTVPTTIAGLTGASVLSGGTAQTCAIVGGAARCWGANTNGQLGIGSTVSATTPAAVTLPAAPTSISTSFNHTCAKLADGTARCWGLNTYGELGDGTTTQRTSPVAVSGF